MYPECLTWGYILINPLKEATLLLSWLRACVELATFVGPVLLHSPCDSRLATQAGCATTTTTTIARVVETTQIAA